MPRAYPQEFKDDVVRIVRQGELTVAQVARDFGISETSVSNWVSKADIEDGKKPGLTSKEAAELRQARKRIRVLEQENEILRRAAIYLGRGAVPK